MLLRSLIFSLSLLIILTIALSGCLPSMPEEIVGPTWTSQYRFPLIKEKRIYLVDEFGINLNLNHPFYTTFQEESNEPTEFEEEPPIKFDQVNTFFTIKNTSPIGLDVKVLLSPDPIDESDPGDIIDNNLSIAANKTETSVLSIEPDQFTDLIGSGRVYHRIEITPKEIGEVTDQDYLEVTAWADATCTFNKR